MTEAAPSHFPRLLECHDDEKPDCVGQWCCGCRTHPIGKPWGWNYMAWERHNDREHPAPALRETGRCSSCGWMVDTPAHEHGCAASREQEDTK